MKNGCRYNPSDEVCLEALTNMNSSKEFGAKDGNARKIASEGR
jgi:hypothetical protein